MIVRGNTVGTTMPRTNYEQTDPSKADYLKGKEALDKKIQAAQTAAGDANTAAGNAHTAANNAQTTANEAKSAADTAQGTANNALPKAGGTMTGDINMGGKQVTNLADPTENAHAANKGYVDGKHKFFTTTLTVNDWEGNAAPYTQRIGIEGILSTDRPHFGPVYSGDNAAMLAEMEAWALVVDLDTYDGYVVFTCPEEKPATALTIQMEVHR